MAGGGGGEEGDFGFQIAPMVDVVFVLLLFFMAMAGQNVKEGFFEIGLPAPSKDAKTTVVPISIEIDASGNVSAGGTIVSASPRDRELKELENILLKAMRTSEENQDPVIVKPSLEARHERVVDVLNVCKTARVSKLSFN